MSLNCTFVFHYRITLPFLFLYSLTWFQELKLYRKVNSEKCHFPPTYSLLLKSSPSNFFSQLTIQLILVTGLLFSWFFLNTGTDNCIFFFLVLPYRKSPFGQWLFRFTRPCGIRFLVPWTRDWTCALGQNWHLWGVKLSCLGARNGLYLFRYIFLKSYENLYPR